MQTLEVIFNFIFIPSFKKSSGLQDAQALKITPKTLKEYSWKSTKIEKHNPNA